MYNRKAVCCCIDLRQAYGVKETYTPHYTRIQYTADNQYISRAISTILLCAKIAITLFGLANIVCIYLRIYKAEEFRAFGRSSRRRRPCHVLGALRVVSCVCVCIYICLCQKKAKNNFVSRLHTSCTMGDAGAVSRDINARRKEERKTKKKEKSVQMVLGGNKLERSSRQ